LHSYPGELENELNPNQTTDKFQDMTFVGKKKKSYANNLSAYPFLQLNAIRTKSKFIIAMQMMAKSSTLPILFNK
jgi:hypothetical protein